MKKISANEVAMRREGTFIITRNLKNIMEKFPLHVQEKIVDDVKRLADALKPLSHIERGEAMHMLAKDSIELDLQQAIPLMEFPIPCRAGCAACCRQWLGGSKAEAAVIAEFIKQHNVPVDMDRLRAQAAVDDSDIHWSMPDDFKRCLFLDDAERCRIYPVRPLVCRGYYVAEPDARACAMHGGTKVRVVGLRRLEMIMSAISNAEDNNEPFKMVKGLSKLLLDLFENKGDKQ